MVYVEVGDRLREQEGGGIQQPEEEVEQGEDGAPGEEKFQKVLDDQLNQFATLVESGSLAQCKRFFSSAPNLNQLQPSKATELRNTFLLKQLSTHGSTALHLSILTSHPQICEWLLDEGANPNSCSSEDWTPLQLSIHTHSLPLTQLLLSHPSTDPDQLTSRGTALHIAAIENNRAAIRLLLDHGADELAKNVEGLTADELATDSKCKEIIRKGRTNVVSPDRSAMPQCVRGVVGVVRSVFHVMVDMYVLMEPHLGTLRFYQEESEEPKKPKETIILKDIKRVEIVEKKKWWMKKELFYVAIYSENARYLAAKYENIAVKWATCLQRASQLLKSTQVLPQQGLLKLYISNKTNKILVEKKGSLHHHRKQKIERKGPNQYTNVRQLGRGSFAHVYLTKHKATGELFAMKVIEKQPLIENDQLKYAHSQIQILKKLSFPFIIQLIDHFQTPTHIHLVLEYCPYGDLSQYLSQNHNLPEPLIRTLTSQIVLAIQYLHSQNILYRDLKPENILISKFGYLKLADFGLSKKSENEMFARTFCGSPVYTCPELLQNQPYTPASDVYGIGCLLYEMFTGDPPFYSDNISKLYDKILMGNYRLPDHIPHCAKTLIRSLLNRTPHLRPKIEAIKSHEFFKNFDWVKMQQMKYPGVDRSALTLVDSDEEELDGFDLCDCEGSCV